MTTMGESSSFLSFEFSLVVLLLVLSFGTFSGHVSFLVADET